MKGSSNRQCSPLSSLLGGGKQVWHLKFGPFFYVLDPTLTTLSVASFESALEDGFGQSVVSGHMAKPGKLAPFHCCQKDFLRAHQGSDGAPYKFIGLVLVVRDAEQLSQALVLKGLDFLFCICK